MNALKMTLKFWGSGMLALMTIVLSVLPSAMFEQDSFNQLMAYFFLIVFVAPIFGGAAQHWFWKHHDWAGASEGPATADGEEHATERPPPNG